MKYFSILLLILISVHSYSQLEVPAGNNDCKIMQKEILTYCIDTETYTCNWTAIQIKGDYIKKQTQLPRDADFFREIPSNIQPSMEQLEKQVYLWAMEFDSIYIVTGHIKLEDDSTTSMQSIYYKAILKGCQGDGLGFVFYENEPIQNLRKHALTLHELENVTGIQFFTALDPDLQAIFKSEFSWEYWPLAE